MTLTVKVNPIKLTELQMNTIVDRNSLPEHMESFQSLLSKRLYSITPPPPFKKKCMLNPTETSLQVENDEVGHSTEEEDVTLG